MKNNWIQNRIEKDRKKAALLVMDIAIAVLAVAMLIGIVTLVSQIYENKDTEYKDYSFDAAIQSQEYHRMVNLARENRFNGYGIGDEEMEAYYAVADYYEAAFYHRIYVNSNDSERAEKYSKKMADAQSRMGYLSGEKEKIDRKLDEAE